jgi:hypothetical protein
MTKTGGSNDVCWVNDAWELMTHAWLDWLHWLIDDPIGW